MRGTNPPPEMADDEFDELRQIVTDARNGKPVDVERYRELVRKLTLPELPKE